MDRNADRHQRRTSPRPVLAGIEAFAAQGRSDGVDDGGPGIDPGNADRLFEPFTRGDHAVEHRTEGAGLGLAIVRDQAAAIGGTISVGGSPFGGARFTLDLPAGVPT